MKRILSILLLLATTAMAEPLPYFEMTQYTTNTDLSTNSVAVSVSGILLTNADVVAEATALMNQFAADPDYFGGADPLAYDCNIHMHDHFNPTPCTKTFVGQHRSNKDKTSKYMILVQDIVQDPDHPTRYLPETYVLAVTDSNDAKRKEKAIQDKDKSKNWKPVEIHL